MKDRDFRKKKEKRTNEFGVHMREKYHIQVLIQDQKKKDELYMCCSFESI